MTNIIKEPLAINKFEHHTFLVSITTECLTGSLNLRTLAEEFNVDVTLNKDRTKVKQGSVVVDKSLPICSTRSKNKQIETNNSFGFVKLSYPKDQDIMYFTNPPDIIPMDCYCYYCNNKGPYAHDNYCSIPKKSNLNITLRAYISAVIYGSYKIKGIISQYADKFYDIIYENKEINNKFISQEDMYNKIYSIVESLKTRNRELYDNLFVDNEHMKISLNDILVLTKKDKDGKFFTGPIMIKYKTGSKKVTIRIRKNGNIELISNPVSKKEIYKEVLDKINKTSQKVRFLDGTVKSFFSSVNLFVCQNKYMLDLKKVYNYIWPLSNTYPKREINKNYYLFSENENIMFKYKINTDKISEKRLYIELERCIIQDNEMIGDYYKMSIQLFAQGHLQVTFGYNDIDYPRKEIDEQFVIIQNLFIEAQNLFLFHISKLIETDPSVIMTKETKNISKKIFETVIGIMPYAKRKKFKIGDKVNIFNYKKKEWSNKSWIVKNVTREIVDNDSIVTFYTVSNHDSIRKCIHNDLRKVDPNNDQVCRLNENGIQKHPYPYSFYGQCQGGLDHYIPPIGTLSRSDNNFYPYTTTVNEEEENWIVNFLLNGYTQEEINNGFLKKIKNDKYDSYCGTFVPGTALIGSIVDVMIDGTLCNVQIIDKYKTHGRGNDNNVVEYKVLSLEDSTEYEKITGKQFSRAHLENRYFEGLLKMKYNKNMNAMEILIMCAKKLHIIRDHESEDVSLNISEKLLSTWNIKDLVDNKIESVTVVQEYIEECSNKILYILKEGKKYIYTFIDTKSPDVYIEIYGLFHITKKIFYPIKLLNNRINFMTLVDELSKREHTIDSFENCSILSKCISFKCIMPFVNLNTVYKQYTQKNMPYIIYFNTENGIYKWATINRNIVTVQKKCIDTFQKYISPEIFDNLKEILEIYNDNDVVSFKPNIMYNNEINHERPFLDVIKCAEDVFLSKQDEIDYIFGRINLSIFKNNISWKIHNQTKIIEKEPMVLEEDNL